MKRLLRKLTYSQGTWSIDWLEIDENGACSKLSLVSEEQAASKLVSLLAGMRIVPLEVCGIDLTTGNNPVKSVGVSGVRVDYGKETGKRMLRCYCYALTCMSDDLWKFTTPIVCESRTDGREMQQCMLNLLDDLTAAAFRYVDGERAFNETTLWGDDEIGSTTACQ